MAQLAEIQLAQDKLEESFSRRMAELEAQLHTGGPAKETVAKVAEEFRGFRELMFNMLRLLRQQISECSRTIDVMETRHRRKALVFLGIPETDNEHCSSTVVDLINSKMALKDILPSSIRVCHRIGIPKKEHHRPILVWFTSVDVRTAVWNTKTKLKGSHISVKEFLTKARQAIFGRARLHFGMRACWSQDGIIVVKVADGTRRKVTTMEELLALTKKYPKVPGDSTLVAASIGTAGVSGASSKHRKNQ